MNFISPARRVKKISLKSESTGTTLALVRVENTIAIQLKLHLTTMLSIAVSLESSALAQVQSSTPSFTMKVTQIKLVSTGPPIILWPHPTGRILTQPLSQLLLIMNYCNLIVKRKVHSVKIMIHLRVREQMHKLRKTSIQTAQHSSNWVKAAHLIEIAILSSNLEMDHLHQAQVVHLIDQTTHLSSSELHHQLQRSSQWNLLSQSLGVSKLLLIHLRVILCVVPQ